MKITAVAKTKNHQTSRISFTAQLISQAQETNPRIYAISFFITGLLSDFSYTGRLPKNEIWLCLPFEAIGIDLGRFYSSIADHILSFCPVQVRVICFEFLRFRCEWSDSLRQ